MKQRKRLLGLVRRDATLLFWLNSRRYGFWMVPRVTRDQSAHSIVVDARWLCFGINVAFVDEDKVTRGL